jgi:dihydroxy-acid dehydratase
MTFYRAAPGGVPTQTAFSQNRRYPTLDLDRTNGCIRDQAHAYSKDGGLAVLYGNIAEKGCIVKTAGVDDSILKFTGRARVCESQEEAVEKILADQIIAGDIVVVVYEGPKGGPGMQEMLYPTSYLKSKGMGKVCAPCSPTAASPVAPPGCRLATPRRKPPAGGTIGLVEEGDTIEIDIPNRTHPPRR